MNLTHVNQLSSQLVKQKLILKIMEIFMQAGNYKISKLSYIENRSNKIIEKLTILKRSVILYMTRDVNM